jgi:DNA-binding CsgD family transcriptional regulator
MRKKFQDSEVAILLDLNRQGKTLAQIAAMVGLTPGVVYHVIHSLPEYRPVKRGRKRLAVGKRALKLHRDGFTLEEIAIRLGISDSTVRTRIKDDPSYIPYRRSRTLGPSRGRSRIPDEKLAAVPQLMAEGWSRGRIADYLGCTRQYVQLLLKGAPVAA